MAALPSSVDVGLYPRTGLNDLYIESVQMLNTSKLVNGIDCTETMSSHVNSHVYEKECERTTWKIENDQSHYLKRKLFQC